MLVFTRRLGESVVIGSDITVTVVAVRGDSVRLGVDVPMEVPVHRQEIFDAIKRNIAQSEKDRIAQLWRD